MLDKLTQFTKLCHTTGHDVSDENGIWVSTRITAKERGEDGSGDIAALDFMRDGEFLLIIVRAIRMMSCFVCYRRFGGLTRWAEGRLGSAGRTTATLRR